MEKERKYWLRDNKIPYHFDDDIVYDSRPFKIFEIYDGIKVSWGIREDNNGQYTRISSIFDNVLDRYGNDRERIIHLKDNKFVIWGRLGDNDVLCRPTNEILSTKPFMETFNFDGTHVHISKMEDNKMDVSYKRDGIGKRVFFDCETFKIYSNEFDLNLVNNAFVKSYIVNGKIRLFIGLVNPNTGVVKSLGYDVSKNEFMEFPLTEYGLINEDEMMEMIREDNIGFDIELYKKADKRNLFFLARDLNTDFGSIPYELISRVYNLNIRK